jgi:uncharacterized protein YkwD
VTNLFNIPFGFGFMCLAVSISLFAQADEVDNTDYLSSLEEEIVKEHNLARTHPDKYAAFLEEWKPYYDGNVLKRPGEPHIITQEGVSAVEEAIRFLREVEPVPTLSPSRGMSLGAQDLVDDAGPRGAVGHTGRDGSQVTDRVNRYGTWQGQVGENISYGGDDAREIVMRLIIDDGVPDRGHRENIFNPNFRVIGVACGSHESQYETMCVITLAADYIEDDQQ